MKELEYILPAVALRGMTILPGMVAHFDISREMSKRAIEVSMGKDQSIFLLTQKSLETEEPSCDNLYEYGMLATIKQVVKLQKGIIRILVEGIQRAKVKEYTNRDAYLEVVVHSCEGMEEALPAAVEQAMVLSIKETFQKYALLNGKITKDVVQRVELLLNLGSLMDFVGNNLPLHFSRKQMLLEAVSLTQRYETLLHILLEEMEVLTVKNELNQKVKERVDKHQKDYVLREQMSVIREELGESNTQTDAEEYENKLATLLCENKVRARIQKEINRFRGISSSSTESAVSRGYIETLLDLPWDKMSEDNTSLSYAKEVLEADHYGLDKVKERVLEFLAVKNLTNKPQGTILCLVGPPGTGKTSIARSIASAMNKEYVRVCLGGVRDEAEIRGHRKTYVGAMPGRIINGLKQAKVKNPLMLLDEIDKVGSDHKGDTASALLEVLDSEQNAQFRDHYVEVPVDLSQVFFVATANSLKTIPKPLLDRMEILEVSSYTENEKYHIAKDYLVKKQLDKHGLTPKQLKLSDKALVELIRFYTREAGVRELERKIGELCRKAAKMIYLKEKETIRINPSSLESFLGKRKYRPEKKNKKSEVGIVKGLAWTSVGGVTLEVEVNVMPGKGELMLTGQLGDVMKESARAGITYIRSIGKTYQIADDYFKEHDIHIHIPEGAVPKDGPSAGITMALAILSAVTDKPVRADIAMTGEITLRGRVLPIGGLKGKLLAAKNAGMNTVCIPKENEKDLEEISEEIIGGMEILPVEHMEQVIKAALV